MGRMLDTRAGAGARSRTDGEFTPAQAAAITNAVRLAVEHGDHVTFKQFKAGRADVRPELSGQRCSLYPTRWT